MAVLISILVGLAGFVAAYVFHLQTRNKDLSNSLGESQADNKLVETLTKEKLAHEETEDAEDDYNHFRASVLRPDGGDGNGDGENSGPAVH